MAVKVSIHSLPTEIKTRVAELCQLQDMTILDVFTRLHYRVTADDDEASDDEETEQARLGPFAAD